MTASASPVAQQTTAVVRPAVRVELSERLYQGVFGVGLATAAALGALSALIALLQPAHTVLRSSATTLVALVLVSLLYNGRHALYWRVRRHPSALFAVAVPLATIAAAAGTHNEQMFYVVAATIAVVGIAAPLPTTLFASVIGGTGIAAPYVVAGGGPYGIAAAATLLPVLFWVVAARLAEYLLVEDLDPVLVHGTATSSDVIDAAPSPPGSHAPPPPARRAAAPTPKPSLHHGVSLTPRQSQVLLLVCEGLRHAEIAECLGITTKRVRDLLTDARARANAATTAHLVAWHLASQQSEGTGRDRHPPPG